ncbi:unnamed protein product [Mycena citricolor]|uniref:Small secreted protein n=1 Tax=Mycena citricolor TaxID=2018698 RepID=A0AAD2K2A6_9AGAR|nr:unnamed protein product [Mycena citricolor]CAK5282945.1 unnamed protein product [Mycena citricolor]CAK5282986.1 unnamed protein product [Mycena citricolor]
MARFALLALLVPALVSAAPLKSKRFSFALQSYDSFQISDGVGGNAKAQADAIFVTPFPADLSTVDATSLANVEAMHTAAENAETQQFDPAISAASGATAAALQVGKIKNKVLKLTAEVQGIKIKMAQAQAAGKSTASLQSSLTAEQTKLTHNIALDTAAAGKAAQGVTGGSAAAAGTAAAAAAPAATTKAAKAAKTKAAKTKAAKATGTAAAAAPAATGATLAATGGSAAGTFDFAVQQYSSFQISDGKAGTAQAQADAIFVAPFPADLTTVSASALANLNTMRLAAEAAETGKFNPQIAAASGAAATALQNGKIKNKVLKLTAEVQGLKIKLAQAQAKGSSTSSIQTSLATEQKKLSNNIALDTKAAGQASKGVA